MITMHARPRQTDGRTNIVATARRFVLTNASRAKNIVLAKNGIHSSPRLYFSCTIYNYNRSAASPQIQKCLRICICKRTLPQSVSAVRSPHITVMKLWATKTQTNCLSVILWYSCDNITNNYLNYNTVNYSKKEQKVLNSDLEWSNLSTRRIPTSTP